MNIYTSFLRPHVEGHDNQYAVKYTLLVVGSKCWIKRNIFSKCGNYIQGSITGCLLLFMKMYKHLRTANDL